MKTQKRVEGTAIPATGRLSPTAALMMRLQSTGSERKSSADRILAESRLGASPRLGSHARLLCQCRG
jgi:hypothetical protein